MNKELHLFILWEKARCQQERILEHLSSHFTIIKMYDVLWTSSLVSSNFSRFYGTNLPNRSFKEKECGTGRFLLVIVYDDIPVYDIRWTSKGEQKVNIHMFDAKTLYREWTGGGHKIHATNSETETNHDITLLLGLNVSDFKSQITPSEEVEIINKDIVGATGWDSITQLFYVMNNCTEYVVLRNWACLPEQYTLKEHGDIDILVIDRLNATLIINGSKIHNDSKRVAYNVRIDSKIVPFDVRYVGDNYYCSHWEYLLLENVVKYNNLVNVLDSKNHFFTLLYHALIHKWEVKEDYVQTILALSKKLGVKMKSDFSDASKVLVNFMQDNGYEFIKPNDDSVIWNTEYKDIEEYINRFCGTLISYNAFPCNHVWYISKVFKCDSSYVKVGSKVNITNEIRCLKRLQKYDCFQKILSSGEKNGECYLETEKIDGVNMSQYFHQYKHLNKKQLKSFVLQCLEIFEILGKEHIQHRDISPEQFIITSDGKVYLIDFGWGKTFDQDDSLLIPPAICGAKYKIYGDNTTDVQMFAQMLKFWFKNMPFFSPVVRTMIEDNQDVSNIKTVVKSTLENKSLSVKDCYIIVGKSLSKGIRNISHALLLKVKNIAKKTTNIIKKIITYIR